MQVFISWSGDRSKAVAELLDEWLQCVLQAIRPWMSSKDIDRGSLWFSEINDQLKDTKIGIICLTKDNREKPWIMFESGALAKGLSTSRVCTFLIDLAPADIGNPLSQFNHTMPTKESVYELVRTLNSSLGEQALRENVLEQVFRTYWPQFEERFNKAIEENPVDKNIPTRSEENILSEVLNTVRSLERRTRSIERSNDAFDIVRDSDLSIYRNRERHEYMSPAKLREEIKKLMEKGVPPRIVEGIMSGAAPEKAVRGFTDEIANEFQRLRKSNSSVE